MTAFPSNPTRPPGIGSIPSVSLPDPEHVRQAKEAATDALVARTRASTPPGVADQRRVPRQSISEINNSDFDSIRERFLSTRRDDRPAWVRVLDAIDAPRNQILSHLAPSLERKARESGDTATFGAGRVNFSDVLGELGMKPGVVRAVVGFAGDLAFDPLTYVGAPGVGLRVANKAGQTVGIGLRGSRDLLGGLGREGAIAAVKRGGLAAVKPGATRDLLEAAAKTAAPGLDNAALASHLSERVLGKVTSGKIGRAFSRVGGALDHEGGVLANYGEFGLAGQLDDEAKAARAFIAQYGEGAGPGIRLGKGATRAVAHIPFTDVGLYVPAFTDKAKYVADTLEVANEKGPVDPLSARGSGVAAVAERVQKIRDIEDAIKTGNMPVKGYDPASGFKTALGSTYTFDPATNITQRTKSLHPGHDPADIGLKPPSDRTVFVTPDEAEDIALHLQLGPEARPTLDVQPDGIVLSRGYGAGYKLTKSKKIPYTYKPEVGKAPVEFWTDGKIHPGSEIAEVNQNPIHATPDDLLAELDDHAREVDRLINGGHIDNARAIDAANPRSIGELYSLKRLIQQGEDAAAAAKARAAAIANPKDPTRLAADAVADAESKLAKSVHGAARNWAAGDPERLRHVQRMIGTDDQTIGSSLLSTVANAVPRDFADGVAAEIAHRIDQGAKATFGQPAGTLRSMYRYLLNTLTTGRRERFISLERELRGQVLDAMESAGLDRNIGDYQKAADLVVAHMAQARNEEARVAAQQAAALAGSELAPAQDMRFFLTDHDTGKVLPWAQGLIDAERTGLFAADGLADSLRAIAVKNNKMLDALGDTELADDILGGALEGYIPNSATSGARARIAAQRKFAVKAGGARGKATGLAQEGFQRRRSTTQYRFTDSEGKARRFFDMDRWATTFNDKDLAELAKDNPKDAAYVEELRNAIAEYDRLAQDPEWAAANAPRNTHPSEMNELARQGRFSLMLGADPIPGGDFMDTNVGTMMAARAMAHESAVANKDWADYIGSTGIAIDPSIQGKVNPGKSVILKDGTEAKFWRDPHSQGWGVEVAGKRYRPLADTVKSLKENPIIKGIGDKTAMLYRDDVARLVEDSANIYEKQGPELLKFLDAATAAWKTQSLMHPSWTVANLVGDTMNYLTGGVRLTDLARQAWPMAQVFRHLDNPEELRKITLTIRGRELTGEQFVNDLRAQRLVGNNRSAETVLQLLGRKVLYMPSHVRQGKTGLAGVAQALNPRTLASDVSTLKTGFLQGIAHQSAADRAMAGAKAVVFTARERFVKGVISPWFRANEVMQDYMRAMAYSSFLEQGHDIPMAVRKTINAGFDYADLTSVERNVFRRIFPFYSWMKNNGAYQLKLLMDRPIYTGMYPLLLNAAEEAINGDQQIPLHARPNWMRNQLALMVGKDDNRQAVMLGSGLPVEQAIVALEPLLGGPDGVQDFLKYFTTSTNTILRAPAEIGVGREFFTDRTIGRGGDIGSGEYIADQFRPYRETGKVAETYRKQGPVQAAARVLLGGRVQSADNERLRISRLREFKQNEEQLRRAIATSGYKSGYAPGSPEFNAASIKPRAEQLRLYEAMIQAGFADETPVWARTQLGQLAG